MAPGGGGGPLYMNSSPVMTMVLQECVSNFYYNFKGPFNKLQINSFLRHFFFKISPDSERK